MFIILFIQEIHLNLFRLPILLVFFNAWACRAGTGQQSRLMCPLELQTTPPTEKITSRGPPAVSALSPWTIEFKANMPSHEYFNCTGTGQQSTGAFSSYPGEIVHLVLENFSKIFWSKHSKWLYTSNKFLCTCSQDLLKFLKKL